MAGDWIKMRGNLWDDPRVARLVDMTDSSEAAVVGGLYWLWATADQHTQDGFMPGLSLRQIDRKTGVQGLGKALCEICWLSETEAGVCLNNFEEHNGQSAKRRCVDAQRKATVRTVSASDADKTQTSEGQKTPNIGAREREEKRREEKEEDRGEKTAPRKRIAPFPVPEWINREHWDAWHSCSKRRNATDKQKQLAVDKLTAWKEEGIDYAAALENAAIGGWQGLFKPDEQKHGGSAVNKQEALEQRNRGVASSWAAGIGNYV